MREVWRKRILFYIVGASLVAQKVKNLPAVQETWVSPWIEKIPWRREWLPSPEFLPGEFHGQRRLVDYSPWGCRVWRDWEADALDERASRWPKCEHWACAGRCGQQLNPFSAHGHGRLSSVVALSTWEGAGHAKLHRLALLNHCTMWCLPKAVDFVSVTPKNVNS